MMKTVLESEKQNAMKCVGAAVALETDGNRMAAYIKYLESIEFMTHLLLIDARPSPESLGMHFSDTTARFITLCAQCIDRLQALVQELNHSKQSSIESIPASSATPGVMRLEQNMSAIALSPSGHASIATSCNSRGNAGCHSEVRYRSSGTVQAKDLAASGKNAVESFLATNQNLTSTNRVHPTSSGKTQRLMSPLEVAKLQNQQLLAAHKARVKLFPNAAANLSLSLQRRMAENISIAQQREIQIERKKQERLERLSREAELRFSGLDPSQEECDGRQLFIASMEYEQETHWLMNLRQKLSENCKDQNFIVSLVQAILRTPDHPLTLLLIGYQNNVCFELQEVRNKLASSTLADNRTTAYSANSSLKKLGYIDKQESNSEPPGHGDPHQDELHCRTNHSGSFVDESQTKREIAIPSVLEESSHCSDSQSLSEGKNVNEETSNQNELFSDSLRSIRSKESYNSNSEHDDFAVSRRAEQPCDSEQHDKALAIQIRLQLERVQACLEKFARMFFIVYPELCVDCELRDRCERVLHVSFYSPVLDHELINFYRLLTCTKENTLCTIMRSHASDTPADFSINKKLCLTSPTCPPPICPTRSPDSEDTSYNSSLDFSSCTVPAAQATHHMSSSVLCASYSVSADWDNCPFGPLVDSGPEPYGSAIAELKRLGTYHSPLTKLECIVSASRLIIRSVTDFYSQSINQPGIGADELLPILSFVVVKTQQPRLLTDCSLLMDMVQESELMSEEGYCLTSLLTAITFLLQLSQAD